jgi:hypothetical protein
MLVGPGAEDSISGTVSACSSGKIYRLCGDGRLACVAITGRMRLGGKRLPLANGPFPRFALMCASAKKGPRSQRVPGGLRTHRFPGAIGRSAAARPCAPCPQAAAGLTKRSASLHAGGPLRGPQRHAQRHAPGADSPRGHTRFPIWVSRRSAASIPLEDNARGAMGGRICQSPKPVKVDFSASKRHFLPPTAMLWMAGRAWPQALFVESVLVVPHAQFSRRQREICVHNITNRAVCGADPAEHKNAPCDKFHEGEMSTIFQGKLIDPAS